jgi:hypothetical protein
VDLETAAMRELLHRPGRRSASRRVMQEMLKLRH